MLADAPVCFSTLPVSAWDLQSQAIGDSFDHPRRMDDNWTETEMEIEAEIEIEMGPIINLGSTEKTWFLA